jgi:uncharacterized damage-inducible protein DinB
LNASDMRSMFAYDRWATRQVLAQLDGVDAALWGATGVVGERGLGSILVHMLGAHQRWRIAITEEGEGQGPEPENEPLPDAASLVDRWEAEFRAMDGLLANLSDGMLAYVHEGIAIWQMLAHLVNHGTQHRSESALLLTQAGRSPGELDLIVYLEEVVPTLGHSATEPATE